jgi:protoheme IX farnesyltransferase
MSGVVSTAGVATAELCAGQCLPARADAVPSRFADYVQLAKLRIATMVLVTVSVGYLLGSQGDVNVVRWVHALVGVGLLATSCSVLNQWFERHTDRQMHRTANRPVAAGRIAAGEAFAVGVVLAAVGTVWLVWQVNVLTASLTVFTLVSYVVLYTPLKRWTTLCTTIGAIPGAMPPVIGWTAAGGTLDAAALALFGILFVWQFPHFFAIAWIYQEDYARAGLRMLPRKPGLHLVGWLSVTYAVVLLPVSLLPKFVGIAGAGYSLSAVLLGIVYLLASIDFLRNESRSTARRLLLTSLIYLPTLLVALTIDHWRLIH